MPSTVEAGYLGRIGIDSGAGGARLPSLAGGNPDYTPFNEAAWSNELLGPDGRYRFLQAGSAAAPTAAMHNSNDTVMVLALLRMKRQASDWGPVIGKSNGVTGWILSEIDNKDSYYVRVDSSAIYNQGLNYSAADMRKTMDRNWHWLGFSLEAGVHKRWLNGDPMGNTFSYAPGSGLASSGLFRIACDGASQTQFACVLVFGRVLTDAEVAGIVSGKVAPKSVAGLQGYYKFNEPSGSVGGCIDYSGAGNHLNYSADISTLTEEWSPDGNLLRDPAFGNAGAWQLGAGMAVAGGRLALNLPAAGAGARQPMAELVAGNTYRVSYEIRNYAGGQVRVRLHGAGGSGAIGAIRAANGVYTEELTLTPIGASPAHTFQVGAVTADCVMDVLNVCMVRLTGGDGAGGMPYARRAQRGLSRSSGNMFRSPPSLPAAAAQCSVVAAARGIVVVPDSASLRLAGDLTITGWIKIYGANNGTIWSKVSSEGRLDVGPGGKTLTFWRNGPSCTLVLPKAIPLWQWVFASVTFANDLASFYVNGVLAGAKPFAPGVPAFTSASATIGANAAGRPSATRSVRVFSRALTADEIENLYWTDNHPRTDVSLVGEWLCNDPWGTQLRDTSGYNNHSLVSGSLVVQLDSPYCYARRKLSGKQLGVGGATSGLLVPGLAAALSGAGIITIVGKVKTPAAALTQALIGIYAPSAAKPLVQLYRNDAGFLQAVLARSTSDTPLYSNISRVSAIDTQLHHYGIEFNCAAKTLKMYLDGLLVFSGAVATSTGAGFDLAGESALRIGYGNNSQVAKSFYDDLRVYSRALSDEEHRGLFLGQAPRGGLVVEYTFDNDVASALDSSGNGLHAAWSGVSLSDYVQMT